MLAILGLLGAIILALRFNVIILLPAILFGWAVALVNGVMTASSGTSIMFQMVLVAVALQLGFVGALVLKWAVLAGRHHPRAGKATATPGGAF